MNRLKFKKDKDTGMYIIPVKMLSGKYDSPFVVNYHLLNSDEKIESGNALIGEKLRIPCALFRNELVARKYSDGLFSLFRNELVSEKYADNSFKNTNNIITTIFQKQIYNNSVFYIVQSIVTK